MQGKKEKKEKIMSKKRRKEKLTRIISIIIFLLLAATVILIIIDNFQSIDLVKNPKKYLIEDECGLIVGNLIHQIKDEGECRIECRNECEIRQESFHDSEFIKRESACHVCNCYCK
jgi:uncharacterized metal-binding protein